MNDEQLFHLALERPIRERAAFLDEACAGDAPLRQRLEVLLHAHENPCGFLGKPVLNLGITEDPHRDRFGATDDSGPSTGTPHLARSVTEGPGSCIGHYQLLEPIGEGGMGVVFLAQQTQPVRRLVALKLIKSGMDSRQVLARFDAERQALALMDHPHIAGVLDAGTTDAGRPYFVMELVRGVPITRFGDERRLKPRQRLELFIRVCQAVQHAHQKGIIHRDLKPSNILVALYDGQPVPKVIDFGVAKATGPQVTERTLVTEIGAIIGTLEYMSPEQAELNPLDVDTRSDIYSLGVLLYELLTGTTPLEHERYHDTSCWELLRLVRDQEPPRPSRRLLSTKELPSIAANRGIEPGALTELVRGELDWIVMKALEKDRARRYETANALATDLQRHLDDEPVQACPPSTWYRLRKLGRRNRAMLAMATVVLAALVLGTVISATQAIRAIRSERLARARLQAEAQALVEADAAREAEAAERRIAERHRAEAETMRVRAQTNLRLARKAVDELYTGLAEQMQELPRMQALQRKFLLQAMEFYEEFARQQSADAAIRFQTGVASKRVGVIEALFGRHYQARRALDRAIASFQELIEELPGAAPYRTELADSYQALGGVLVNLGRLPQAEEAYRQATLLLERLVASSPAVPDYQERLSVAYRRLGILPGLRAEEAEQALRNAIRLGQGLMTRSPNQPRTRGNLAESHYNLGYVLASMGRNREAERAHREGIALGEPSADQPGASSHRRALVSLHRGLGDVLTTTGRTKDAEGAYGRAIGLGEALVADFPDIPSYRRELAIANSHLAAFLERAGRLDEAIEAASRSARNYEGAMARISEKTLYHQKELAGIRSMQGRLFGGNRRPREAVEAFAKAIDLYEQAQSLSPGDEAIGRPLADCCFQLARLLAAERRPREAVEAYRKASSLYEQAQLRWPGVATIERSLADCSFQLAGLLAAERRSADAVGAYRAAATHYERELRRTPGDAAIERLRADCSFHLTRLLAQSDRPAEAAETAARSVELYTSLAMRFSDDPGLRWRLAFSHHLLGRSLIPVGRYPEAARAYRHALALHPERAIFNNDLAWILVTAPDLTLHDPMEAVRLGERAAQLEPKAFNVWNTLGVARYRAGDYRGALAALEKAEELGKGRQLGFDAFFIAMSHWRLGRHVEARRWYSCAVRWMEQNAPDDEELRRFRAETVSVMGPVAPMPNGAEAFARD